MKLIGPKGKVGLERLEQLAGDMYGSEDIEIDPLRKNHLSCGDHGIWVRAWVHIDNATLREHGVNNPEADSAECTGCAYFQLWEA